MTDTSRIITARTNKIIAISGDTLFAVAARELGDATQWNRIAALNGLTDPYITESIELRLPPVDATASNGGIHYG